MKPKHKRLIIVLVSLASIFAGTFILLNNFRDNLIYFYPPKDIAEMRSNDSDKFARILKKSIRVGGMIKPGSYKKTGDLDHRFTITDLENDLEIRYHGLLPPMFREGQGVVAQGNLVLGTSTNNIKNKKTGDRLPITSYYFNATQLITKHDEKYMPPEIAGSLKK